MIKYFLLLMLVCGVSFADSADTGLVDDELEQNSIELSETSSVSATKQYQAFIGTGVQWKDSIKDRNSFQVPLNVKFGVLKDVKLKFQSKIYWKETSKKPEAGLKHLRAGVFYNFLKLKKIRLNAEFGANVALDTRTPMNLVFSPALAFKQSFGNFGVMLAGELDIATLATQEISGKVVLAPFCKFGQFAALVEGLAEIDKEGKVAWSIVPGINWLPGSGFKLQAHAGFGLNNLADKFLIGVGIGHVFDLS